MKIKPTQGICPYCNFDLEQYQAENAERGLHYLQPGSILNGRFMVGKVLGEGGFGITYIGWNLNLDMPIAIKEYFPNGFVTRNAGQTDMVSVLSGGGKGQFYLKQKERFLDEAKTLGRLDDIDSIVSVKDCFAENGTAYIIMEYLEGEDFGAYLRRKGGKLPANQVFDMMKPIIEALALIHKDNNGLIHRDISPDNIRITKKSKVKLMDFGAARETEEEKSLSVVLKPGYAPEEQYRTRGKQGPWTDVYGLCATMYRAIVGKKPIESLERIAEDHLKAPSELGISIDEKKEKALMKGLAVLAKNRWQSMDELHEALYGKVNKTLDEEKIRQEQEQEKQATQQSPILETLRKFEVQGQFKETSQKQLPKNGKIVEKGKKAEGKKVEGKKADGIRMVVAINPGYEDMWDTSLDGRKSKIKGKYVEVSEDDLNLSVALQLREELQKRGYRVIMTREKNSIKRSVLERVEMAEKRADLLITLHCKDVFFRTYSGARTLRRKKGYDNEVDPIGSKFYKKSNFLAQYIVGEYCKATGLRERGCYEANLLENNCGKLPAVILEMGCLGNEQDELYMADERNQKIMAEGIANGISLYKAKIIDKTK